AAGEAPLTIGYGPHAQSFVNQGAPIEWVALEPVVVIINTISLTSRPAHPAAAKLFYDFLLSKAAQAKLREMSRIPSRGDVEPDPPRLIRGFKKVVQDVENEHINESIMPTANVNGVEIYYETRGSGEPVLLVPPDWWPCATWNVVVVPVLSRR